MKEPQTVTDDKGNVYVVPGQMTRKEAEVYFPSQPERLNPETTCKGCEHEKCLTGDIMYYYHTCGK